MEHIGEECMHHHILSQGGNEMTKNMKAMTEKGGTEEGHNVGLTCDKNRQSNKSTSKYMDKDRGEEHHKKTASAVFLLMFIFE